MNYTLLVFALSSSLFLNGCMSWFFGESEEADHQPTEQVRSGKPSGVTSSDNDQLELKIAKLWAKVSELEDRSNRQRERLGVLEKGLMLGVLPEELKNGAEKSIDNEPETASVKNSEEKSSEIDPSTLAKTLPAVPLSEANNHSSLASDSNDGREALLAQARTFYEAGQYGRAIAVYSKIDLSGDQSHRYWVALCWFHLKEYETSFKEFSSFISNNEKSPWIPRAKYHLARVEYQLGYRERAIKQMKSVIQEFPEEDAADMARASVSRWEKAL